MVKSYIYIHKVFIMITQETPLRLLSCRGEFSKKDDLHNRHTLSVIKAESLYQLVYLRFICYKLKLIDVITIPTSLSISHN